jgi:hypothetical protein
MNPHRTTSYKTAFFIVTAVKTSDFTYNNFIHITHTTSVETEITAVGELLR